MHKHRMNGKSLKVLFDLFCLGKKINFYNAVHLFKSLMNSLLLRSVVLSLLHRLDFYDFDPALLNILNGMDLKIKL